jgi:transglutaminase-like putative cysteine protease
MDIVEATMVNDQPISASLFDETHGLTEYITPNALEIQELHRKITNNILGQNDRINALWQWVASEVDYTPFVKARMSISGRNAAQGDYWAMPGLTARVRIGNCATKSFLLTSLLRNELPADRVYCVLGNLQQPGNKGGHAWVEVHPNGTNYIMESTRGDMPPMVMSQAADIYESVIYFNDQVVSALEGRTVLQPFSAVFVEWLKDYLDWKYIEGGRR